MSQSARPALTVVVQEAQELKHDGNHFVEVTFQGRSTQSDFVDGYGSFKSIDYSTRFPISSADALSPQFWSSGMLYITVVHERMLTSNKVVGECAIAIGGARTGPINGWYPLRYKGQDRGALRVRISPNNVPSPAASATVPSPYVQTPPVQQEDVDIQEAILRDIRESRISTESASLEEAPLHSTSSMPTPPSPPTPDAVEVVETVDLLGLGSEPASEPPAIPSPPPPAAPPVSTDWPK